MPTLLIAAENSLHPEKADIVCDGINDQDDINTAIEDLKGVGGLLECMEGTFNINGAVQFFNSPWQNEDNNIILQGRGASTKFLLQSGNSDSFSMFKINGGDPELHNITLRDFAIDGNKDNVTGLCSGIHPTGCRFVDIEGVTISNGLGHYGIITSDRVRKIRIGKSNLLQWGIDSIELRSVDEAIISDNFIEHRFEMYASCKRVYIHDNWCTDLTIGTGYRADWDNTLIEKLIITDNIFFSDLPDKNLWFNNVSYILFDNKVVYLPNSMIIFEPNCYNVFLNKERVILKDLVIK